MLPDEAYKQFKEICLKRGISLSDEKTVEEANNLISLFKILRLKDKPKLKLASFGDR